MTNTSDWGKNKFLKFENQDFDVINLTQCEVLPNPENWDFNTELFFDNCTIASFNAATLIIGKKISFNNCRIGYLGCYATYFCGGFSLTNSVIGGAQFDCGAHNKSPHEFIIENCEFEDFAGFFDIYFEGPVQIIKNNFKGGANIKSFLEVPHGIKEGIPFILDDNQGQLDKSDTGYS